MAKISPKHELQTVFTQEGLFGSKWKTTSSESL